MPDPESLMFGIGDVWLLSGQSNIDVTIERVYPQYASEIDTYENPQIRMFRFRMRQRPTV